MSKFTKEELDAIAEDPDSIADQPDKIRQLVAEVLEKRGSSHYERGQRLNEAYTKNHTLRKHINNLKTQNKILYQFAEDQTLSAKDFQETIESIVNHEMDQPLPVAKDAAEETIQKVKQAKFAAYGAAEESLIKKRQRREEYKYKKLSVVPGPSVLADDPTLHKALQSSNERHGKTLEKLAQS